MGSFCFNNQYIYFMFLSVVSDNDLYFKVAISCLFISSINFLNTECLPTIIPYTGKAFLPELYRPKGQRVMVGDWAAFGIVLKVN